MYIHFILGDIFRLEYYIDLDFDPAVRRRKA